MRADYCTAMLRGQQCRFYGAEQHEHRAYVDFDGVRYYMKWNDSGRVTYDQRTDEKPNPPVVRG